MSNSATVETLTAEVLVLMVGNRQVTLSVYRQLDSVPKTASEIEHFEAFGRVRTGKTLTIEDHYGFKDKFYPELELVGRDTRSGSLVRLAVYEFDLQRSDLVLQRVREWRKLPLIVLAGLR